jgi:hypothetical protein
MTFKDSYSKTTLTAVAVSTVWTVALDCAQSPHRKYYSMNNYNIL